MRKIFVLGLAITSVIACNSSSTSGTSTDTTAATDTATSTANSNATDSGWINLFDGTSLNNWHTFGETSVSPKWSVDSGTIHFNPDTKGDDGDLVSNDSFENFDLKVDWKIAKGGNSGILFYVQDDKPKYEDTYKPVLKCRCWMMKGMKTIKYHHTMQEVYMI